VALVTDLLWGRIFNWLTIPAILIGLAVSFFLGGWNGLGSSFLGVIAAFVIYGALFAFRVMGAGDVKLLMAIGAWGGLKVSLQVALLGVLLGGAMAFVILLFKGRLPGFLRKIHASLLSFFVRELEFQPPKVDRKLTMPFGIPLAIAAIWVVTLHPFEKWGWLW